MNRLILLCAMLLVATAALGAQESTESNPYEGVSNPPPDSSITAPAPTANANPSASGSAAAAKPQAGHYAVPAPVASTAAGEQSQPASASSSVSAADTDSGVVGVSQSAASAAEPTLAQRPYSDYPGGDIVHPQPLAPGELAAGVTIRVELLGELSTADSEKGDVFRSRVASDVLQNGQVLIPAGSEIDGRVAQASSGHFGGHGTLRLRPETVILPNGARYQLYADLTGTPDARARVNGEGTIRPDSHFKRNTVEFGAGAGGGAATGAMLAGPAGAVTGGLIGAGVVTAHLLFSHPQATLKPGTTLLFTLAQPLQMSPSDASENQSSAASPQDAYPQD